MTKYCIIGGLGYIGYALCERLSAEVGPENVTIVDNNIYGKWTDDDIDSIIPTVVLEDVLELEEDFFKDFTCAYLAVDYGREETLRNDGRFSSYINRFRKAVHKIPNLVLIPEIDTFGFSKGYRNDTFINNLMYDLTVEKVGYITGDIYEEYRFAHIDDYVNYLLDPDKYELKINCVNKLTLASLIQNLFGSVEYKLSVEPKFVTEDLNIEYDFIIQPKLCNQLKAIINVHRQAAERGLDDFFSMLFNNEMHFQGMLNAIRYRKFLGEL